MPLHDKPETNYPHDCAHPNAVVAWLLGKAYMAAGQTITGQSYLARAKWSASPETQKCREISRKMDERRAGRI